jgi:Family of unknown function (DUF5678)
MNIALLTELSSLIAFAGGLDISLPFGNQAMIDIANLGSEIEKYENKWVAIDDSEEKIVGVGDDAFEATADAERKGYSETILFKVPSFDYH